MSNSKIFIINDLEYLQPNRQHLDSHKEYSEKLHEYLVAFNKNTSDTSILYRDMYYLKIEKTDEYFEECKKKYAVAFLAFYSRDSDNHIIFINYITIKIPSFYDGTIIMSEVDKKIKEFEKNPVDLSNNSYKDKSVSVEINLQFYYNSDCIRCIVGPYLTGKSYFGTFQRYTNNEWGEYKDFKYRIHMTPYLKFYNIFSDKVDKLPIDEFMNFTTHF